MNVALGDPRRATRPGAGQKQARLVITDGEGQSEAAVPAFIGWSISRMGDKERLCLRQEWDPARRTGALTGWGEGTTRRTREVH